MPSEASSVLTQLISRAERILRTDVRYILSGGSWLFVNQGVAVVASFLLAVAFGNWASQDLYGNYKYALSIAALIATFSLTGLATAIITPAAQGKEGVLRQSFKLSLKWSFGVVAVGLAAAYFYYLQGNPFVAVSLCIASFFTPLISAFALYDPFQIGLKEFKRNAIFGSIQLIVTTLVLFCALYLGTSRAIYFVLLYFIVTCVCTGIFYAITVRRTRNQIEDANMLRFGSHVSAMNVLSTIADRFDAIVVFTLLGPAQFAVYAYALAMPEQIKNVIKILGPLSVPKFANRSITDIGSNIWLRMIQLGLLLIAGSAAYILAAPYLFEYLFPVYKEATVYSQIYALSILSAAFIYPIMSILQSHQKTAALYVTSNVAPVILMILLPVLTYQYGLMGAILSQVIYRFVNTAIHVWQFSRISRQNA